MPSINETCGEQQRSFHGPYASGGVQWYLRRAPEAVSYSRGAHQLTERLGGGSAITHLHAHRRTPCDDYGDIGVRVKRHIVTSSLAINTTGSESSTTSCTARATKDRASLMLCASAGNVSSVRAEELTEPMLLHDSATTHVFRSRSRSHLPMNAGTAIEVLCCAKATPSPSPSSSKHSTARADDTCLRTRVTPEPASGPGRDG